MQQGRYGGVRGLGGYNTAQQGSDPIVQISEVKRKIEDTEKTLADIVEDKKTPSSNTNGQGSHSIKGYSTIRLLDDLNKEAQYVNIMADIGGLNKILGGLGAAISGGISAVGSGAKQIGGAIKPYAVEGLDAAQDIAGDVASDTMDAVGGEVTSRVLGPNESESESQN
jgi:hypothetical protein